MFDCANVEMRELLPELAAGLLDAATRARVEAHVLGCDECASELETLRLVRASFANSPVVDTTRIVASLPRFPATTPQRTAAPPRASRWLDWRVAAALTMITVGGLSVAITQRVRTTAPADGGGVPSTIRIDSMSERAPVPLSKGSDTGTAPARGNAPTESPRPAKVQLALGTDSDGDLDDASLKALLGALDDIERGPIAPSAEPDGTPVLPVIREGSR